MKVIAINGSPRKNYNTAALLNAFIDGAKALNEEVEAKIVHLYDYQYKGCTECYACKLKSGTSYGKCAHPDDIHELLEEVSNVDVVVFGSPIFFFDITGELRSFLERLFYPYTAFKRGSTRVISPKKVRTAFLYTMNVTEQEMKYSGYEQNLAATHGWTKYIFGYDPEIVYAYNTYQYKNYDSYVADLWDVSGKKKWHDEEFPKDCKNAFELGQKLVEKSI